MQRQKQCKVVHALRSVESKPMSLSQRIRLIALSTQGRWLARRTSLLIKPLLMLIGMKRQLGRKTYHHDRETLVVVSHEASATGAPILALNLCQKLCIEANIVVMLVGGGALAKDFQETALAVIQPRLGLVFAKALRKELKRLIGSAKPHYAIVNSVASARYIQPLRSLGIPTITLIHEFAAYIRPLTVLDSIGLWSNALVFSSRLTRDDLLARNPQGRKIKSLILPQGPCQRPNRPGRQGLGGSGSGDARAFLNELKPEALLILGAGEIQPRKGVDLFIGVADKVIQICDNPQLRFAWIGSGYDPIQDFNVSLWLDDQIQRAGITSQVFILDHSEAYGDLLERADLFLVTSRLDPLPNVAIDALRAGKPTLCFERACGIANLLQTKPSLAEALVAPYLNTAAMAAQASYLLTNSVRREEIGRECHQQAEAWFNMEIYVQTLQQLGRHCSQNEVLLQQELEELLKRQAIQPDYGYAPGIRTHRAGTLQYLLAWRTEIWPRKPFPGFHPGLYRQHQLAAEDPSDPLLHYLKAGSPAGPWRQQLITPASPCLTGEQPRVALHLHVHYPELLGEILVAVATNRVKPDLFVSCSSRDTADRIAEKVSNSGFNLKQLVICPNRGRDIGPLLTEFGPILDRNYAIHGHLHTKKSALIGAKQADQWRRFLTANLLGTSGTPMTDRIIQAFQADPGLGLVFPDDPTCVGWCDNLASAQPLASRLGLGALPQAIEFPVGTMFWARQGALSPLYNLKVRWDDYPSEPLPYDGTMLHAVERLLTCIAQGQGFHYRLTHRPGVNR